MKGFESGNQCRAVLTKKSEGETIPDSSGICKDRSPAVLQELSHQECSAASFVHGHRSG